MKKLVAKIFFLILLASCKNIDVFEKTVSIPDQNWTYNFQPSFTFNIIDTISQYNIFIIIRHSDAYKYNNIWVKTNMKFPGDSIKSQNIDLTLATDASGWKGSGMDDIFEYRKNITPGPIRLKKPGEYTFSLSQIMRENPLGHILNVGLRVEKVKL